jgi:hypothetical protein
VALPRLCATALGVITRRAERRYNSRYNGEAAALRHVTCGGGGQQEPGGPCIKHTARALPPTTTRRRAAALAP